MIRYSGRVSSQFHVEQTLKYLDTIFDNRPSLGRRQASPATRDRARIVLDEDLFSPAPLKPTASAIDLDERPWPTLELPPEPGTSSLEKKIVEQERELSMRCTQVADLYNLQERQAAELHVAYAEIERLNAAFEALQDTATQHAMAAAERKQSITVLNQENAVLRSKLQKALDDAADLATKMLTVETLFNDREMIITTTLEHADLLNAELAATATERSNLTRAIEQTEQLHQEDRSRNEAIIDELNRKLESLFADNSVQFKTREKLAKRCDELAKANAALDSAHKGATAKIAARDEHATFLETVLRVERETAAARIKELTEKLEQERTQRTAADHASSAMRQEMAILLRQIAQRQPADAGERQTPAAHRDAA
jgi:chromosome segregation ATPase